MKSLIQRALVLGLAVHSANKQWLQTIRSNIKLHSFDTSDFKTSVVPMESIPVHIQKSLEYKKNQYTFKLCDPQFNRNVTLADGETVKSVPSFEVVNTNTDTAWNVSSIILKRIIAEQESQIFNGYPLSLKEAILEGLIPEYLGITLKAKNS